VEELSTSFVDSLVSVSAEKVALRLKQVRWQAFTAVSVMECQSCGLLIVSPELTNPPGAQGE